MKHIPAFPVNELHPESGRLLQPHYGMTLRDYFAAKAMQSRCSADPYNANKGRIAEYSYNIADAMLKEREK